MMSQSKPKSPSDTPTATQAELPERLLGKLKIEIPGYELLDEIACGGQATVYRAREVTSGLTVAIKLLHAGPYANEASRQRLQREIAALKALNHPNIVCVIEAGQTSTGLDYLVMNYVDGRELDAYWKDCKTIEACDEDPAKLLRLFQTICETVAAAHRKGITHRDLSPSNIRIDADGQPHILDFGLASTAFDGYLTPGGNAISVTGQFIGKLAYASPEQAKGSSAQIDIRTDVYALGVILYQIITGGCFPYEVVGNLVDVLNNIVHSRPVRPSTAVGRAERSVAARRPKKHLPQVNATIEAIVLKALEKNQDDRYQSAGELAREIDQYLRGKPAGPNNKTALATRKRIVPTLVTACGVGVMVVTVYLVFQHRSKQEHAADTALATSQPSAVAELAPVVATADGGQTAPVVDKVSAPLLATKVIRENDLSSIAQLPFAEITLGRQGASSWQPLSVDAEPWGDAPGTAWKTIPDELIACEYLHYESWKHPTLAITATSDGIVLFGALSQWLKDDVGDKTRRDQLQEDGWVQIGSIGWYEPLIQRVATLTLMAKPFKAGETVRLIRGPGSSNLPVIIRKVKQ